MKSFKSFLLNEEDIMVTPKQAAELVFKNCMPFLKEAGFEYDPATSKYLYRGMKIDSSAEFQSLSVRRERKPVDTPYQYHKALDDYLYGKFGIRYRSAAIFATGRKNKTKDYGRAYVIFPIGTFKFIWEKRIPDFFEIIFKGFPPIGSDLVHEPKYQPPSGSKDPVDVFNYMLKVENFYKDTDFKAAILSGNEIMISCDTYYIVKAEGPYFKQFKEELNNLLAY